MKKPFGSIKLGEREIPLKKDKTLNLRHLTKDERKIVGTFIKDAKKEKKDIEIKALIEKLKAVM